MEQMTVKDIVKATGGRLLCGDENKSLAHICIDSNQVRNGDLFVPLIGERVDAPPGGDPPAPGQGGFGFVF